MKMPPLDPSVLKRKEVIAEAMRRFTRPENVIAGAEGLRAYESDGLSAYRERPLLAILPDSVEEIVHILRYCEREKIKIVPRGAGTSLSGGALPLGDGILLCMAKFNRILEIDPDNLCAVLEPGVTNLAISRAVEDLGLHYAPDPSSQIACTIGGNVAENAGGVHCLKYGLTTHNLLGMEILLIDGTRLRLGGKTPLESGYDLQGVLTGSEGLLAVVTEATVKLTPKPSHAKAALLGFPSVRAAAETVAAIIGAGIIPAGMEMMDRLAMEAAEAYAKAGYPLGSEALLILELDGLEAEVSEAMARVLALARENGADAVEASRDDAERERFWRGRKSAFPAVGRLAPDYYCMDGTIPRRRLAEALSEISRMSEDYGLAVANVFHAGDGNLHPLILYDANKEGELERAEAFGQEILRLCVKVGGVLTGEHGVGVEKRDLMETMFSEEDLAQQQRLKCAFDPDLLLNPGKMFPRLRRCAELGRVHVHRGRMAFPDIERF